MGVYSSKCRDCAESSKRVLGKRKYQDDKGAFYINFYQCDNCSCDIFRCSVKARKKHLLKNNKTIYSNQLNRREKRKNG